MTVLSIFALIANAIALCIVAYQTFLTRQALGAANRAIRQGDRERFIQFLPSAPAIINVSTKLKQWSGELGDAASQLDCAGGRIGEDLVRIGSTMPTDPAQVLRGFPHENLTGWLDHVLICGAQHYFNAAASLADLQQGEQSCYAEGELSSLADRCRFHRDNINGLLDLIQYALPDPYLNCPASLGDRDFVPQR